VPVGILVLGLVSGSLAGLNSIGFVLLWRTSRVVNLAQPALGLVGGVLTGMLVASAGWGFWWAAPVGIVVGSGLSIAAERFVINRLQDVPRSVLLIATVGLAQVFAAMYAAIPFMFGGRLPTYSLDLGFRRVLDGYTLQGSGLLAIAALIVVVIGVHLFLATSRLGVAALALGQDVERARSLGVPAALVRTAVWAIAGTIASIAGILSIPVLGFGLEAGALSPTVLLLALAPAVFAGLRSIWGAAVAALALSVVYQLAVWYMGLYDDRLPLDSATGPYFVLAIAVVAALALQRRRLAREDAAARAASWEAAATQRPLPWRIARALPIYIAARIALAVALLAAVLPPLLLLSPSQRVSYGTAAAFALGAMAITCAWMFAGELPLGHWGFAGIGAAIAVGVPGSWVVRTAVAGIAIGALNVVLAFLTQRRSSLAFAVVGLAAAAIAPAVAGSGAIPADTRIVGAVAGGLTVLSAALLIVLRASTWGARVVAARDDPQRAPWLGVDPNRGRMIGLALSGVMVGVAGALFVASTPAGIARGSFDPGESLRLLAIAVVGGLGSPASVLIGAVAMTAAQRGLPSPWNGLTSGFGVLLVVMFLPAGIARAVERIRDTAVGLLAPAARPRAEHAPDTPRETVHA
jgi:ABC-type branched-subunit amino acid transport system permease subunit